MHKYIRQNCASCTDKLLFSIQRNVYKAICPLNLYIRKNILCILFPAALRKKGDRIFTSQQILPASVSQNRASNSSRVIFSFSSKSSADLSRTSLCEEIRSFAWL